MITELGIILAIFFADTTKRPELFFGGVFASYAGTYGAPFLAWYDWRMAQGWRLFDDGREWKQMDKLGHVWTTYHLSWVYHDWARFCGYSPAAARRLGAVLAWSFQTSIELVDGFFPKWGASLWDALSNTVGSGIFWINTLSSPWRVDVRFSFFPSPYAAQRPEALGRGVSQILKDYNGQTYWLVLLHEKFPLGLAIGHGARGLLGGYGREPISTIRAREHRRWLLSVDPHWELFFKKRRWMMRIFVSIKTPFPALVYERHAFRVAWIYF
ncbi:MAG: YfiM family protein [Bacteroidia bacterium]|nr:YfiM family protein [Bacteroidia bacterium]MCX7652222.1 YfiM family protein [Bacteroidia bacterium]MDW8416484.1 DUF2279 domain-containing protein [Bacteroidia bacterium]